MENFFTPKLKEDVDVNILEEKSDYRNIKYK